VRGNVIRPFLTTRKQDLVEWCVKHSVPWIEDTSNLDTRYTRNYIRHKMMPHVLKVNPGIYKMVKKRLQKEVKDYIVL
jgi:tRNA(Ile)-lysidine synthase